MDKQPDTSLPDEAALDALLDSVEAPSPSMALRQRILLETAKSQEASPLQWILDWLSGDNLAQALWRPAMAFVLPLCFGITLGLNVSLSDTLDDSTFADEESHLLAFEFEDWTNE
ncbi:MAG: hypothetical protein AAF512_09085 [Pseudomonadota bacterium]